MLLCASAVAATPTAFAAVDPTYTLFSKPDLRAAVSLSVSGAEHEQHSEAGMFSLDLNLSIHTKLKVSVTEGRTRTLHLYSYTVTLRYTLLLSVYRVW